MTRSDTRLIATILFFFFAAAAATAWLFLVKKEYDFFVEAPCDMEEEVCFVRDCSNPDDCPPNSLKQYKIYKITARDFDKCTDGTCVRECSQKIISCTSISCGDSEGDTCTELVGE